MCDKNKNWMFKKNERDKQECIEWLKKQKCIYCLTICFQISLTQRESVKLLNVLYRMINNEYFGTNNKKKDYITMIASKEVNKENAAHFHISVLDHGIFKAKRNIGKDFEWVVQEKCLRIKKEIYTKGRKKTVNPISALRGVDVQAYHFGSWEEYVMKDLNIYNMNFDFLSISNYEGFTYEDMKKGRSWAFHNSV